MNVRGGYQPKIQTTPDLPTTGSGVKPPPSENARWDCGARHRNILPDGQNCDWPVCGCDPYASKVLDAIAESRLVIVKEQYALSEDEITKIIQHHVSAHCDDERCATWIDGASEAAKVIFARGA